MSKFRAWSTDWNLPNNYGIQFQSFKADPRQTRQHLYQAEGGGWKFDEAEVRRIARLLQGSLFFMSDEPNTRPGLRAEDYAAVYDQVVRWIRSENPTARFSSAGIAGVSDPTLSDSPDPLVYAQDFANAVTEPVHEWRFHSFYWATSIDDWAKLVQRCAAWTAARGVPMVLGSFGAPGEDANTDMSVYHRRAMELIQDDDRIAEACYWCFNKFPGEDPFHRLTDLGGNLTEDGRVFLEAFIEEKHRVFYLQRVRDHAEWVLTHNGLSNYWVDIDKAARESSGNSSGTNYLEWVRAHARWVLNHNDLEPYWRDLDRAARINTVDIAYPRLGSPRSSESLQPPMQSWRLKQPGCETST